MGKKEKKQDRALPRRRMPRGLKYFGLPLLFLFLLAALAISTDSYLILLPPLEAGVDIDRNYGNIILVLEGGLKKGREIGYSTEERLLLAVELFQRKKRNIIVSGGSMYRGSPAIKKTIDFFSKRGIAKEYIHFEGKSQTTFDNFINTRQMIAGMKTGEVIVCTSPYHQQRVRMILDYLGITDFKIARMKTSEIYQANSFRQRMRNWKLILREYVAIVKFKIFTK